MKYSKIIFMMSIWSFLAIVSGKAVGYVLKKLSYHHYAGKDVNSKAPIKACFKSKTISPKGFPGPQPRVFIDARRLYWGNMGELTKPDHFVSAQPIQLEKTATPWQIRNAAQRTFIRELRDALKAFKKRHDVEIVWRKNSLHLPDATNQFIDFWSAEYKQPKEDIALIDNAEEEEKKTEKRKQTDNGIMNDRERR